MSSAAPFPRTAVVTGASSGIGAATARALADAGFSVVCAARRVERLEALAAEIGGTAVACDVTDPESVAGLAAAVASLSPGSTAAGRLDVLVNNAGGAIGLDPVESADPGDWTRMYEVNVLGVLRVTQALLPALRASGDGVVVNVGSTAGRVAYEGGAGYTAAKHGLRVMTETLRLELVGEPIRISEVAPGMVATEEFSLNRFGGDADRASSVYDGVPDPLVAEDVADAIAWVATRPAHVNIDELVIKPRAQAAQHKVHRV
ncbi:SDR family NAD(P)-dependent oxidoreductase [Nocardioides campestrisoli]|uniref:SDR family NAD(P)-dependent oxidoreductase n=1 Tax=Nocardioides campestrisoli TaxID=2736757 RepID=UPI0015E78695|nr:SDR family NAD(P)-dependent oxidoreductase [Nocardioides campestrisoli]